MKNLEVSGRGGKPQDLKDPSKQPFELWLNDIMENISKGLIALVVLFSLLIVSQLSKINEYVVENGGYFDNVELSAIGLGIGFALGLGFISGEILAPLLQPYFNKSLPHDDEKQRLHKVGLAIRGAVFYAGNFASIYYVIRDTPYLPKIFGGNLNLFNNGSEIPFDIPQQIRTIYLIGFGYHLERMVAHLIVSRNSKSFFTMNLHHILTVVLIGLSFFMHHFIFGTVVFMLHDFSDSFLWTTRLLRETRFESSTTAVYCAMAVAWVGTRVLAFFHEVLLQLFWMLLDPKCYVKEFYFSHVFFFVCLTSLEILNVFWAYQILQIGYSKLVKKQTTFSFEDAKEKRIS